MARQSKNTPLVSKPRNVGEKLLWKWTRDLCTRTEVEMRKEWTDQGAIEAIDDLDPIGFERRLKDHNFIYYVAENFFFDNTERMKPAERRQYLYEPFHRELICKPLEKYLTSEDAYFTTHSTAGAVVIAQRDSFKSTICHGAAPLAVALRELNVNGMHCRIGLLHQKEEMAIANLKRLKAKSKSHERFRLIWPEFASNAEFGTELFFHWPCLPEGVFAEPSVIAGGMNSDFTGWHVDYLFGSDLVTREQRTSKSERLSTVAKWESLLYIMSSVSNKKVVDGTLYHGQDLNSKLLAAKKRDGTPLYNVIKVGAGGTRAGKPLTLPYRHTESVLEQRRDEEMAVSGTDEFWWKQYQCELRSEITQVAKAEWYRPAKYADIPSSAFRILLCDPAWKGTHNAGEGCAASMQVWAIARSGLLTRRWLLDGLHSRHLDARDGKTEMTRLVRKHNLLEFAVEDLGSGGYSFAPELERELADNYSIPVTALRLRTSRNKKDDRIQTFFNFAKQGLVFICEECPNELSDALREETEDYGSTDDKDAVDCAGYTCDPAVIDYVPDIDMVEDMPVYGRIGRLPMNKVTRYCFR